MIMAVRMKEERAAERRCRMKFMVRKERGGEGARSGKTPVLFLSCYL